METEAADPISAVSEASDAPVAVGEPQPAVTETPAAEGAPAPEAPTAAPAEPEKTD